MYVKRQEISRAVVNLNSVREGHHQNFQVHFTKLKELKICEAISWTFFNGLSSHLHLTL